MSGKQKVALSLLYLELVIIFAFILYNVNSFVNPPFNNAIDPFSNNVVHVILVIADLVIAPRAIGAIAWTIKLINNLR